MNLKKIVLIINLFVMMVLCNSNVFADKIIMKWSYDVPQGSSLAVMPETAAKLISEDKALSEKLEVKLYPARQLYKAKDALQAVMRGDIQAALIGSWYLISLNPYLAVSDLPFLFDDLSAYQKAMDGDLGEIAYLPLEKHGIKVLGGTAFGAYSVLNNDHEVLLPKDVEGMKIRSMGLSSLIWKELGAIPTSLPAGDIYMSLKRNIIHAADISIVSVVDRKLYEVANHYTQAMIHGPMIISIVNSDWLNSLPEDIKEGIVKYVKKAKDEHVNLTQESMVNYLETAKDNGVIIHHLTDNEKEKWRNATKSAIKEIQKKENINLDQLIEIASKYNK